MAQYNALKEGEGFDLYPIYTSKKKLLVYRETKFTELDIEVPHDASLII